MALETIGGKRYGAAIRFSEDVVINSAESLTGFLEQTIRGLEDAFRKNPITAPFADRIMPAFTRLIAKGGVLGLVDTQTWNEEHIVVASEVEMFKKEEAVALLPKDLLVDAETGDRTMEHLKKADVTTPVNQWGQGVAIPSDLSNQLGAFQSAMGQGSLQNSQQFQNQQFASSSPMQVRWPQSGDTVRWNR